MKTLLIVLALLLTGCASQAERMEQDMASAALWCGQFYDTDYDLEHCAANRYREIQINRQKMYQVIGEGLENASMLGTVR